MSTTIEALTRGLPEEFFTYVHYCRNLKFEEKPDYDYLSQLLHGLAEKEGLNLTDNVYDWVSKDYEIKKAMYT